MEDHQTPEILDYRNEKGQGWRFYNNNGILRTCDKITPEADMKMLKKVQKFELRDDDVMVVAYPKCGCHWLWEIVTMLRAGNSEYNRKTKEVAMLGMPFGRADEIPSPRVLNSHLYSRHLPGKMVEQRIKTIFILRNPKDVSVSFYNMFSGLKGSIGFDGTYSEFLDLFMKGKVPSGDYADYVKDWLQVYQDNPDLPFLTMFYENLKKDPVRNIKTVAEFLGVSVTDELCEQIAEACSFKKLKAADVEVKEQKEENEEMWKKGHVGMYRKGEVGDWKNWITVAENERFDEVIQRRFKGTGIVFTYE